jgi:hypothetical protein
MSVEFIGVSFPENTQWHEDEVRVIETLKKQIDKSFYGQKNLFINSTWFGPRYDNGQYEKFTEICSVRQFDNVFLMAAADPVTLANHEIDELQQTSGGQLHLVGHFDTRFSFNFHSIVLPNYFKKYSHQEVEMLYPKYTFVNYNRKPRDHRTKLVKELINRGLEQHNIITHGTNNADHQVNTDNVNLSLTLNETIEEIGEENQWWPDEHGIPHDIHSLGRLDVWQNHFLSIVSETEHHNDNPTFVSEKTWKPVIGMRPFIINGQTKVYKWLRERGFRTFNQYWDHIPIENAVEAQDTCADVAEFLSGKLKKELQEMYKDMTPDLLHNKNRFYEFSREQKYKTENLF